MEDEWIPPSRESGFKDARALEAMGLDELAAYLDELAKEAKRVEKVLADKRKHHDLAQGFFRKSPDKGS